MKEEKKKVEKRPYEFIGSTVECVTIDGVDTMLHPGAPLQLDPDASFTKGLLERRLVRPVRATVEEEAPKTTRSSRTPSPSKAPPPPSKKGAPASRKGKA